MKVELRAQREKTVDLDLDGHVVVGNILFREGQTFGYDFTDLRVLDVSVS